MMLAMMFVALCFTACDGDNFIEKGKSYYFDENSIIIIGRADVHYSNSGSATVYDKSVKISAGKIDNTFTIEHTTYSHTQDEKVVNFDLLLDDEVCKAEFHKTNDGYLYLKIFKNDYEENIMIPCENFIQIGRTYRFDENSISKGHKLYQYDDGGAYFSENSLTISIGGINKTYKIVKALFYKNESSPNYRADLILSYDDEECEAVFGMGGASRSLHIYFPKPSNDIEYSFMWFH